MKLLMVAATGAVLALSHLNAFAEVIPIEEEFVFEQQVHVDTSLDMVVISLLRAGLVDSGATLHYQGSYDIHESTPGNFTGTSTGELSGMYLGEPWSMTYASGMSTDVLQNKIWDLDSKGKWKKGPYSGKDFKDKGKLIEKTDNTADLELEIETDGVPDKIKTTASNVKKDKGGGKLKVSGEIEITDDKGETHKEKLTIDLDQATKTFKSQLTSKYLGFGVVVLENSGSFTSVHEDKHTYGDTSFNLTVTHTVPEPSAIALVAAGLGIVLARRGWRARKRPAC